MNLLFNLLAVQPIHNAKFHGGGSYGEELFWALIRRLDSSAHQNQEIKIFCAYDSKKYLDAKILTACQKYEIPLLDIHEFTPQQMVNQHSIDTFYTPLYSLEKKWQINVDRFVFTWHGVRALEIKYSALGIPFAKSFSQKWKL